MDGGAWIIMMEPVFLSLSMFSLSPAAVAGLCCLFCTFCLSAGRSKLDVPGRAVVAVVVLCVPAYV